MLRNVLRGLRHRRSQGRNRHSPRYEAHGNGRFRCLGCMTFGMPSKPQLTDHGTQLVSGVL